MSKETKKELGKAFVKLGENTTIFSDLSQPIHKKVLKDEELELLVTPRVTRALKGGHLVKTEAKKETKVSMTQEEAKAKKAKA